MPRSSPLVAILVLAALAGAAPEPAADPEARLAAMPLERRLQLAENLDRFDALPPEDQAAIRRLDRAVTAMEPAVRDRYRALLRRYRAWAAGLDEAARAELAKAPSTEARLALVARLQEKERATGASRNLVLGVYPGDLGAIPPFEMANILRVWLRLDKQERTQVEALPQVQRRLAELNRIGRQKGFLVDRFPAGEETKLVDRLEADEQVKAVFPNHFKRQEKAEANPAPARPRLRQPLHHLAESIYFVEHPPAPVSQANLSRFADSLPPWFRASIDPLTPEAARRRLSILYRQIYPPPAEMPAEPKAPPLPRPGAAPAARPASAPPPSKTF